MASSGDPAEPRDEYEKAFMDLFKQKSPTVYPVASDFLRLFESAYAKAPSDVFTFYTPTLPLGT